MSATIAKRPRIFYGWYVMAIVVAAGFMGSGTSQVFFGLMLKPITEDLDFSRTTVATAVTIGSLVGAFAQPLSGMLADRYGPRVITTLGLVALAVAYFVLSGIDSVWHVFVGYVLGRGITQASLTGVVARTAAVNWFRRMRGRALGFTSTAPALGSSLLVLFASGLMAAGVSWRTVFVIFGIAVGGLFLPALLVLRRRPEDMGLLPDGDEPADAERVQSTDARSRAAPTEHSWTLSEARRTPAMWLIIFSMTVAALSTGGLSFNMVVYFTDKGVSDGVAGIALSSFALSGAIAATVWGFLTERFSERWLAIGALAIAGCVSLAFIGVSAAAAAVTIAALYGFAARGEGALINMIIAAYYGRDSYGRISGFVTPFQFTGLALGPAAAAFVVAATGSFTPYFVMTSALLFAAAVGLFLARRPALPPRLAATSA